MALNFYTSIIEGVLLYSIELLLKVLLLVILLKISKKNKYGSKCLKLPKSSRNAKKSSTFKSITNKSTFSRSTVEVYPHSDIQTYSKVPLIIVILLYLQEFH